MNKWEKEVQQSLLNSEEAAIKELEKQYARALKDINDKVKLFQADIDLLDQALNQDGLDEAAKTALLSQKRSKIYQKQYQQALKSQISGIVDNLHSVSYTTIDKYLKECYEYGYIGTMYDIAMQGIPVIAPIDQAAVVKAVLTDSKVVEGYYNRLGVNYAKLKKTITQEVSRGIASSLPYSDIARNINNASGSGLYNAKRIARTEGHRIQQESTADAQEAAKKKGADVVKQWDATLDGRTRPTHRMLDGQIREVDKPFEAGGTKVMRPGQFGIAAEDINCRCACLTRARWALDDDELQTLKDRAEYFGLDKTADFEDFKDKYLKAAEVPQPQVKKEYLTEKKLNEKLAQADVDIADLQEEFKVKASGFTYDEVISDFGSLESFADGEDLKALKDLKTKIDEIELQKIDWQGKLDKKLVAKEIKTLKKEKIALQNDLDNFDVKTYSGIWKDDVTTLDWKDKSGSIQAKKKYFENKLLYAVDASETQKWKDLFDQVDDFDKQGSAYFKMHNRFNAIDSEIDSLKKNGLKRSKIDAAFSQERKDAAYWFTDSNGGVKGADKVLRSVCGDVWQNASNAEREAIYEYTRSYHKFNEPLRGIEYGTNKFLGVGNVDLNEIGTNYGGFKRGEVKKQIDDMTSIIEKSTYKNDFWVQRGCDYGGMDKFFGIDANDFSLSEADLAAKLIGTTPTEHGFLSTGVSKGKGFSHKPIIMNIYAPSGTKMMYAEPFSAFGNGSGKGWDGLAQQSSFGDEAEMIFQRETTFRITKVEKSNGKIYLDMEVIEQEKF